MGAFFAGYFLSLSLIMAIGAQNAFVLRQGLRRSHVFVVCLTCALSDAVLITAGVAGIGWVSEAVPWLPPVLKWGGIAFLFVYGLLSFRSAWRGGAGLSAAEAGSERLGPVLAALLAITWLNPHVYLDTVVLIGSIAAGYPGERLVFGIGAVLSSFSFFFALGYGAAALRPLFARPRAWQVLDAGVGVVMWAIALSLILSG